MIDGSLRGRGFHQRGGAVAGKGHLQRVYPADRAVLRIVGVVSAFPATRMREVQMMHGRCEDGARGKQQQHRGPKTRAPPLPILRMDYHLRRSCLLEG